MKNRIAAVVLSLVWILLSGLAAAYADDDAWTCPVCGQTGNTGNYCPGCGSSRPGEGWTCSGCGQAGNTGDFCISCGMFRADAVPEPIVTAVPVDDRLEKILGESDCVKLRLASVDASRYVEASSDSSKWAPAKAADGDESTCWQFDSAGKGTLTKTWLDLALPAPQAIDAVWFKSGFWGRGTDGKLQYSFYARPKDMIVAFMTQGGSDFTDEIPFTLIDDRECGGWQKIDFARRENVVAVRIYVKTYTRGSRWPNRVCLSEVMLVQNTHAIFAAEPGVTNSPTVYELEGSAGTEASLKATIAGRSGPSTKYEEPGSFFLYDSWRGQSVRVTGKAYTSGVWWVEVDFEYSGQRYRIWTGLKRVNVDTDLVPEQQVIGAASLDPTPAWYGPGENYARCGSDVQSGVDGVEIYGRENGFVQVDFYDAGRKCRRRVWVPESALSDIVWY